MDRVTWVPILNQAACVSFQFNALEKGMKPCLLPTFQLWVKRMAAWYGSQVDGIHVMSAKTGAPWASGGCFPGTSPHRRGMVYCLAPEASLLRGMTTELKAFLEPPGMYGYSSAPGTHNKKGVVPNPYIRGRLDKYHDQCQVKRTLRRTHH